MKLTEIQDLLVGRTIAGFDLALDPGRDAVVVNVLTLDDGSQLYLKGFDTGDVYLDFLTRDEEHIDFQPDPDEVAEIEAEAEANWEAEQDAEDEAKDEEAVDLRATCEANDWRFLGEQGIPVCNVCGCYGEYDHEAKPGDDRQIKHIRALADLFERWQLDRFRQQTSILHDPNKFLDGKVIEVHKDQPWPAEDAEGQYVYRWFKISCGRGDDRREYLVGMAKVPWNKELTFLMASFMVRRDKPDNTGWLRMILSE